LPGHFTAEHGVEDNLELARMQMVRTDLVDSPPLGLCVPKRSHLEFDRLAKSCKYVRVKRVGSWLLPGGASEVAHHWLDHRPQTALPTARRKRSKAAGRSGVIDPAQVAVWW
jgi:hypothetical protein